MEIATREVATATSEQRRATARGGYHQLKHVKVFKGTNTGAVRRWMGSTAMWAVEADVSVLPDYVTKVHPSSEDGVDWKSRSRGKNTKVSSLRIWSG